MTINEEPVFYVSGPTGLVAEYQQELRKEGLAVLANEDLHPGDDRFRDLRMADIVLFLYKALPSPLAFDPLLNELPPFKSLQRPPKLEIAAWERETAEGNRSEESLSLSI